MKFPKRVIVAVDIADDMEETLAPLRKLDFMKESVVHFVHVSMTVAYNFALEFGSMVYPVPEDRNMIQEAVIAKIKSIQDKVLPYDYQGAVSAKCLFSEHTARAFCDYVTEQNADLVVVAPRSKHGIFESSFANYVMKHSKTNMLLLKPH